MKLSMKQSFNQWFSGACAFAHAIALMGGMALTNVANAAELVKEISVKDVQTLVENKVNNVAILDANNAEARADAGVIKEAILLSSYREYALSELPKDKNTTLVFYCYNSYCQASHIAAERAVKAGYKDARVMKEGIVGWNEQVNKAGV